MFDDRRKLRKLRKEVEKLEAAYAPDFRAAKTEDDYWAVQGEYDAVAADDICRLENFETHLLRKKCESFGIELPPYDDDQYWDTYKFTDSHYLSDKGKAKANRDIVDARFAYWKRWIDVMSPVATVLISVVALILAGLSLYLQAKSSSGQH
jgi:hypothetical protein